MLHRRSAFTLIPVVALVAVAGFALPAQAQQAAAYTNDFEDASDIANWENWGYPFTWAVDASPIGGHNSDNSLNYNNGTDIDGDWPYGDVYNYNDPIDITGLDTPMLAFWCRYETYNESTYPDHRLLWVYDPNYNSFYGWELSGDQSTPWGYQPLECPAMNEWHQHIIPLQADQISAGSLITEFYFTSDSYYQGAGLDGWFIDDLQILVPDVTPPDAISDLAAANPTETELQLSWTSPNDDDVSGQTASFDLRFSTSPITGTSFATATQVTGEPAPGAVGTQHTVLLSGLTEDTTYYFAIQTTDIAGNISPISNVPSLATLAPPPPPPAPGGSSGAIAEDEPPDDILPCSAGSTAAPTGLLALAGVIALAAFLGMLKK